MEATGLEDIDFYLPPSLTVLSDAYVSFHYQVIQVERERAVKWGKMIQKWSKYQGTEKLHRRVNKGIPNSVRGSVWRHVLQIDAVKEDGIYEVCACVFAHLCFCVCCVCVSAHKSCLLHTAC